ncbi:hypothetical protein NS277_04245 [Novosphingobium barchaimii]|nr:hypothetical protein NS277_04245 [Novosphingobium barchaimii]
MGLVDRTIGMARARKNMGMADLVYNIQRLAWLEGRTASASRRSGAERPMLSARRCRTQPEITSRLLRTGTPRAAHALNQ